MYKLEIVLAPSVRGAQSIKNEQHNKWCVSHSSVCADLHDRGGAAGVGAVQDAHEARRAARVRHRAPRHRAPLRGETHTHTDIHTYAHIRTNTGIYIYEQTHTHKHTLTYTHNHKNICLCHAHKRTLKHSHTDEYTHTHTHIIIFKYFFVILTWFFDTFAGSLPTPLRSSSD